MMPRFQKASSAWNLSTWIFDITIGDGGVILDQRLKFINIP